MSVCRCVCVCGCVTLCVMVRLCGCGCRCVTPSVEVERVNVSSSSHVFICDTTQADIAPLLFPFPRSVSPSLALCVLSYSWALPVCVSVCA